MGPMHDPDAIRVVSFDAVGTLLHFAEPVAETYARIGAIYGFRADPEVIASRIGEAMRDAPSIVPPPGEDPEMYERAWWRRIVAAAFDAGEQDAALRSCFEHLFAYYAAPEAWRMHDDLPDLLARLQRDQFRLAMCSNFDGRLPGLLDALGLHAYFDVVMTPRLAGSQKPEPGIFQAIAAAAGFEPRQCLHVGDHEAEDLEGARAAGFRAARWSLPPGADLDAAERRLRALIASPPEGGFATAEEWRAAAMRRPVGVSREEMERRRRIAEAHNREHGITDPDRLADQRLYIEGRMTLEEYEAYLVFKHRPR